MLQRKQSLYLFFVFLLSVLLFTGPFAFIGTAEGGYFLKHSGVTSIAGDKLEISTWPLTVLIAVSALLSLFTIFSYKNRPRQMRLSLFQMFFNMGLIALVLFYAFYIMNNYHGLNYGFQWRIVIPPIMLILLIMAFRGIRKDELLIKAYDRIR